MIPSLRSSIFSLGCLAVLTGLAAAQDGGFVDDPSSAPSQSVSSAAAGASASPSAPSAPTLAQPPAKVGIALLPGVIVPKPGQPLPANSITASANAAVQALTPKLGLTSYEQSRVATNLTGTLNQANMMCTAHGDSPAASQDQLNSLYTSGLNQVSNVLSDPQKQILQTMVSSNAAAAAPPTASQFGLSSSQQSQLQTIAQNQRQLAQAVMNNPSLSQEEKTAQIQAIRQQTQSAINGVLTPAQQQQLQQTIQARQAAQTANGSN